jgi:hypothetical protein
MNSSSTGLDSIQFDLEYPLFYPANQEYPRFVLVNASLYEFDQWMGRNWERVERFRLSPNQGKILGTGCMIDVDGMDASITLHRAVFIQVDGGPK